MDKELEQVRNWAAHGTIRQFLNEAQGKVIKLGYTAELEGNTLSFHRQGKREFLGIGARQTRQLVLQIVRGAAETRVVAGSADPELAKLLGQH